MSLKAKIEAVIYAAEEPVTLPQLAGLFGVEAESELRRREVAQGELPLGAMEDPGGGDEGEAIDLKALNAEATAGVSAEAREQAAGPIAEGDPAGSADRGGEIDAASVSVSVAVSETDGAGDKRGERERGRRVREMLRGLLDELMRDYATSDRGLEIREVAGGFRMATKPEYHDAVRGFARTLKPPLKLTLQALETLAVVAYKQPVTGPEVSEIRGVDSGGVLGSLMGRKLVQTAGRKQVIGRPILYRTTKDFLLRFGLKDIAELPSIEEFEKMASEMAQEEIPMADEAMYMDPGIERGGYGVESPGVTRPGEDVIGAVDGGGSIDSPSEGGGVTVPQADGDDGQTPSTEDAEPVDGRMSGLDPADVEPGDDANVDSPALDAEVHSGERTKA